MPSARRRSVAVVALIIGMLFVWSTQAAGTQGMQARLRRLWPELQQLPEQDRKLLMQASLVCELRKHSKDLPAMVVCLRSGARELDNREAALGWRSAARRLGHLLRRQSTQSVARRSSAGPPGPTLRR